MPSANYTLLIAVCANAQTKLSNGDMALDAKCQFTFAESANMALNTDYTEVSDAHMKLAEWVFLAFLVLKLCGVIAWSWWWVFAPLWAAIVLGVVGAILKSKHEANN